MDIPFLDIGVKIFDLLISFRKSKKEKDFLRLLEEVFENAAEDIPRIYFAGIIQRYSATEKDYLKLKEDMLDLLNSYSEIVSKHAPIFDIVDSAKKISFINTIRRIRSLSLHEFQKNYNKNSKKPRYIIEKWNTLEEIPENYQFLVTQRKTFLTKASDDASYSRYLEKDEFGKIILWEENNDKKDMDGLDIIEMEGMPEFITLEELAKARSAWDEKRKQEFMDNEDTMDELDELDE